MLQPPAAKVPLGFAHQTSTAGLLGRLGWNNPSLDENWILDIIAVYKSPRIKTQGYLKWTCLWCNVWFCIVFLWPVSTIEFQRLSLKDGYQGQQCTSPWIWIPSFGAFPIGSLGWEFWIILDHPEQFSLVLLLKDQMLWVQIIPLPWLMETNSPVAIAKYGKHMDVSKNSGAPKWMVYKGKPY